MTQRRYRIRVAGVLGDRFSDSFDAFTLEREQGCTVLTGACADSAAVFGSVMQKKVTPPNEKVPDVPYEIVEATMRGLERELGKLSRKVAARIALDPSITPVRVDEADVRTYLGRTKVHDEVAERTTVPGVATGLAVTGTGGDVLFVEASASDGEVGLTLTGQLGDVMKESAQIALSYVRSHAPELGIDPARLRGRFHVHVPAGAVPKDGPSESAQTSLPCDSE
jgi:ATP-dependent Lon protease